MAVFTPGVAFKQIKRSFGNITTTVDAAGRNILKSKIANMTNPRAAGQVKQRSKFTTIVKLAKAFAVILVKGFNRRVENGKPLTQRNIFVKNSLLNAFPQGTVESFDPTLLVLGEGGLLNPVVEFLAVSNGDFELEIEITSNIGEGNASASDVVLFYGIGEDGEIIRFPHTSRATATYLQNALEYTGKKQMYYYIAFAITAEEWTEAGENSETVILNRYPQFLKSDIKVIGNEELTQ